MKLEAEGNAFILLFSFNYDASNVQEKHLDGPIIESFLIAAQGQVLYQLERREICKYRPT